jgi:uncharacterized protein (TIGR03067 family)
MMATSCERARFVVLLAAAALCLGMAFHVGGANVEGAPAKVFEPWFKDLNGPLAAPFAHEQTEKMDKEQALFQGAWQVKAMIEGGNKKDDNDIAKVKLIFKANKITVEGIGEDKHASFKIDSTKKPKQIDIFPEGGGPEKIEAIYEFDGDTLKLCGARDDPRPTGFKSEAGSRTTFMQLKKIAAK